MPGRLRLVDLPRPDIVIANANEIESAPGALWAGGALATRAEHLRPRICTIPFNQLRGSAVAALTSARPSEPERRVTDLLPELRPLLQAGDAQHVRLLPQVWSAAVFELIDALNSAGVSLDPDWIPRVSATQIRYWSTKIGARELLGRCEPLRPYLPAATICNSVPEVVGFMADAGLSIVVKTDSTIGGCGVWRLHPETRADAAVAAINEPPHHGDKSPKGSLPPVGPYLVEQWIGPGCDRPSPSVDVLVLGSEVLLVGFALQLLRDGTSYGGATDAGDLDPAARQAVQDLSALVGEHLRQSGYRGLLNIDFVFDKSWTPFVAEINLRQSAPLDQSLRPREDGADRWAYAELVPAPTIDTIRRLGHSRIEIEEWRVEGDEFTPSSVYTCGNPANALDAEAWDLVSELALGRAES